MICCSCDDSLVTTSIGCGIRFILSNEVAVDFRREFERAERGQGYRDIPRSPCLSLRRSPRRIHLAVARVRLVPMPSHIARIAHIRGAVEQSWNNDA